MQFDDHIARFYLVLFSFPLMRTFQRFQGMDTMRSQYPRQMLSHELSHHHEENSSIYEKGNRFPSKSGHFLAGLG
jgi:hypothetical protein